MFSNPTHNIEYLNTQPGMTVLELGVGAGDYTLPLARRVGPTGSVYVADIQKDLLTRVRREAESYNLNNIYILWTDFDRISSLQELTDDSMDRIILANTLFQLEHPQRIFQEMFRVLKKDGLVVYIDWRDSFGGIGPQSQRVTHPDRIEDLAIKTGLLVHKRNIDVGPHHYGFVFTK